MIDHPDVFGLWMNLLLGPHEGDGTWTEGQLRRAWGGVALQVDGAEPRRASRQAMGVVAV